MVQFGPFFRGICMVIFSYLKTQSDESFQKRLNVNGEDTLFTNKNSIQIEGYNKSSL